MKTIIVFAIYSILFELIVWGIFGYAVFVLNHNGWWMLLAVILSSGQLRLKHFGGKESE